MVKPSLLDIADSRLRGKGRSGVALVIVLAFVVILTGLIVAFFSRALVQRQSSNANASQRKAELFADGATEAIIGDLRQEIADGSVTPAATPAPGVTIYTPTAPANMVPERMADIPQTGGLENLVKRSAHGQKFSSGANASMRAADLPTTQASQNGRVVSSARWNAPLLMPVKSGTDYTPNPSNGSFTVPDWILVARDGSNPKTLAASMKTSPTGESAVLGRYAYTIYDEGGLVDINAAGYPSPTINPAVSAPMGNYPFYKTGLSFADLTQLTSPSINGPLLNQNDIDQIVGWRHYATASGTGTTLSPLLTGQVADGTLSWSTATAKSNYYKFVLSNTTGFLRASNASLVNSPGLAFGSDQLFANRQHLVAFFRTAFDMHTDLRYFEALRYLTHFTRGLEQPSLAPPKGRPTVLPSNSGGNIEGPGHDDAINPSPLLIRVNTTKAGGRNDGSDLVQGDPLVKKRFALNRLAWLTYKGPTNGTASRRNLTNPTPGGADNDIYDLENNQGMSVAFLQQGNEANIGAYFGLRWDGDHWVYGVSINGKPPHTTNMQISTLAQVQAANREPDFFELLKASILAGALGKSFYQSSGPTGAEIPYVVEAQRDRDNSIDFQVIQIGANIIDQFDVDGFPTRIQFQGQGFSVAKEFRGVENLPYLYRVRSAAWRTTDPGVPVPNNRQEIYPPVAYTPDKAGVAIMVLEPEMWNPHSYDSTNLDRSLGNPRPQNLHLYAYSGAPALPPAAPNTTGGGYYIRSEVDWNSRDGVATFERSPQLPTVKTLDDGNTRMDFVNDGTLYREPTMLIKTDSSGGTMHLTAPGFQAGASADGLTASSDGVIVAGAPTNTPYVGIYVGKTPIMWNSGSGTDAHTNVLGRIYTSTTGSGGNPQNPLVTYQVLCDNPNGGGFQTYDEKYGAMINLSPKAFPNTALGFERSVLTPDYYQVQMFGWTRFSCGFDPRTSRFGFQCSRLFETVGGARNELSGSGWVTKDLVAPWVSTAKYMTQTMRPDNNAGYGLNDIIGLDSGSVPPTWYVKFMGPGPLRYGLFAQNTPNAPNNTRRFTGDNASNDSPSSQYYQDADGVVRRGMAAYTDTTAGLPAGATGQPLATSYEAPLSARQKESRPVILNRPFRSVAELGYVFSDTPWKNLDFSTAESGYAPLLDMFCINDTPDSSGLVAGKVNLNTRQSPVIKAVLTNAYRDDYNPAAASGSTSVAGQMSASESNTIANALITRTTSTGTPSKGPLKNVSELTGKWVSGIGTSAIYDGFSADLTNADANINNVARFREAPIRALSAAGQTRVWNLMIDVVAQVGRYPQSASTLGQFVVEGEQRYWVHIALDRFTGQVLDKQIEAVKE